MSDDPYRMNPSKPKFWSGHEICLRLRDVVGVSVYSSTAYTSEKKKHWLRIDLITGEKLEYSWDDDTAKKLYRDLSAALQESE
jgi:hypothetical protein